MMIPFLDELRSYGIEPRHALHVGAHVGAEYSMYRDADCEVRYIEANPDVYKTLIENVPPECCENVAVSDHLGQIDLHVTSMDQSSSVLPLKEHSEIYPTIVHERTVTVPCVTIDDIRRRVGRPFDFLNIDIQGAELIAFRGAGQVLSEVDAVMSEVNRAELYEGCALMPEVDRHLRAAGLIRVRESFAYHESWGDALYVRRRYVSMFDRLIHRVRRVA